MALHDPKKDKPYSQKLCIIQLFKGDMNGGLKYLMDRVLMKHINNEKIVDDEIFGSRTGKTGIEALLGLQLLLDHSRVWKINTAILFNNADGCFDRIPPTLAQMALQRIGCPDPIAKMHTILQQQMKHYVKTAMGISKGFIKFGKETQRIEGRGIILILLGLIGGIGQGGGGSPIIWMAVLMIMLAAYKINNEGTEMKDCVIIAID